jgi:hypothetical protein
MSAGRATEIMMCGERIHLGDYMEVEYTGGDRFEGGRIKGTVTELWSPNEEDGVLQARLSCGWCFHKGDRVLVHKQEADNEKTAQAPD